MWQLSVPWWEFVFRAVAVYFFVLALLRITGKRQVGQLSPFDLVLLLIIANTVQNSMNAGDNSLVGGLISAATIVLLTVSALGFQLGLPTFLAGAVTALIVFWRPACHPFETLRNIPWGILPLVAGLFVLVAGLENSGASIALANALQQLNQHSASLAAWLSGILIGIGCNLVNNLPAALLAGSVLGMAHAPGDVHAAVLIGVDLGPNLSITGSLATILWLAALRREGLIVDGWTFLKLGAIVMPPALVLALAGVSAFS